MDRGGSAQTQRHDAAHVALALVGRERVEASVLPEGEVVNGADKRAGAKPGVVDAQLGARQKALDRHE